MKHTIRWAIRPGFNFKTYIFTEYNRSKQWKVNLWNISCLQQTSFTERLSDFVKQETFSFYWKAGMINTSFNFALHWYTRWFFQIKKKIYCERNGYFLSKSILFYRCLCFYWHLEKLKLKMLPISDEIAWEVSETNEIVL